MDGIDGTLVNTSATCKKEGQLRFCVRARVKLKERWKETSEDPSFPGNELCDLLLGSASVPFSVYGAALWTRRVRHGPFPPEPCGVGELGLQR